MSKAFGEQTPTQGETAVSWQTWSDGAASVPDVVGDPDYGQLTLPLTGAEARSPVTDLGNADSRTYILTANRYGTGSGSATLQIRGDTITFLQNDVLPAWIDYTSPVARVWRYVQVRETTGNTSGGTYYVDFTNGLDSNPGTQAQPWKTITKVNATTFQPGDWILFKCGETWSGTRLTPANGGSSGAPVVFSNYGSGALPIITAPANANSCRINYNYITLQGIDFRGGTSTVIEINAAYIIINGCSTSEATGAAHSGITAYGAGTSLHDIQLLNNNCFNNAGHGILIGHSADGGPDTVLLQDNNCYGNGVVGGFQDHGIYVRKSSHVTARGNNCYNHIEGSGLKLTENSSDCVFERNYSHDNSNYGIDASILPLTGNVVKNNLFANNGLFNIYIQSDCLNVEFYHNTAVNAGNQGIQVVSGASGNILKNNLAVQDQAIVGANHHCLRVDDANGAELNTFDNNDYVNLNGATNIVQCGSVDYTLAGWRGRPGSPDANGINADPVFVTNYSDLHIQTSSPCKNAGATGTGVTDDYDGATRDATPDIGAYEYV